MPAISATPKQGYYYNAGDDTLYPMSGPIGPAGASMFCLTLVGDATANVTLTAMAAATDYFNGTPRYCAKLDLAGYTQCRMVMRKMATAGAAGSSVQIGYSLTNPASTYAGASLAGVGSVLTGTNLTMDTGWVDMPAGMRTNDVYVFPLQTGGDGSASPVVGGLWVFFRSSGTVTNFTRMEEKVQFAPAAGVTATAYTDLYQPIIFDKSKYVGYSSIVFQCDLNQANAGSYQCWAQLAKITGPTVIAGSEVTQAAMAQYSHVAKESGDISSLLSAGQDIYECQVKVASGGQIFLPFSAIVVRY